MSAGGEAIRRTVTIRNVRGLHARAAAKFCDIASAFDAEISVTGGDTTVGGCSLMALLMLGAGIGTDIVISASGAEADAAVDALTALVDNLFDETA